jgi:hypothetical protein
MEMVIWGWMMLCDVLPLHPTIAAIKRVVRAKSTGLSDKSVLLRERFGQHSNNQPLDVKGYSRIHRLTT